MRTAIVLMACLLLAAPAAAGSLDEIRTDVRTSEPDPPRRQPRSDCEDDDDCCDSLEDELIGFFAKPICFALLSPLWGPAALMGDDYACAGYFPKFPYEQGISGYMMIDPDIEVEPFVWSAQFSAELGSDFENLSHTGGRLLFDTKFRLGFDATWLRLEEDLPGGGVDELDRGDANFLYRFAQSRRLQMRVGGGFNWLTDDRRSDYGLNFTYGGDWFPVRPLVVSAEIDLGTLGHASLFHARATLGAVLGCAETYVGIDHLGIGNTDITNFIGGVRVWF